jgi:glycolate oxidase FAD binding subunit
VAADSSKTAVGSPDRAASEIAALFGPDRVREPAAREAAAAGVIVEPENVEEIAELVRLCERNSVSLAPLGAARTLAEIRRDPVVVGVSLARMARVAAYEPDDMTIAVEAGITLAEIARVTAASRQRLPADAHSPPDATAGALIAAHHGGPLRLSEGTVRDILIGIRYVGRGGRTVHAGGRVVKNVAGYDLMKVMTGSFGTLGIITEATFKVRPAPAHHGAALCRYDSGAAAFHAARWLNDLLPLAYLEVMSPAASERAGLAPAFTLVAGCDGSLPEIESTARRIREQTQAGARAEILEADGAIGLYQRLRDLDFSGTALAAQVAVIPAKLGETLDECGAQFRAHAGSGVAQVFLEKAADANEIDRMLSRWRALARNARGHARVLHAAGEFREKIDFFDAPEPGAFALMRRMKAAFDPAGVFNPGCFVGGL